MAKFYQIEILDKSLNKVAEIINPYPINNEGMIVKYSNELSNYGACVFRVANEDPQFKAVGDFLVPHKYHIRIRRKGEVVWAGAIVDNPARNKNYTEVRGYEYLFYLDKKRIKRDNEKVAGDGLDNYRLINSGTMAAAVNAFVTEARDNFGANHILKNITIGSIENPPYPKNFTTATGVALTGGWNFNDDVVIQFDYHSVLHVLRSLAAVSKADFKLDKDLVFSFKEFLGVKRQEIGFTYGTFGNIINYDLPRYGMRMVNDFIGMATDEKGKLLKVPVSDSDSITNYGTLESSLAYTDITNINMLRSKVAEEMELVKTPDSAPVNIVIDDKTWPIGTWDVGDIINVKIKDNIIDFNGPRRIVGRTVLVHNTGKEIAYVQTNKPADSQVGA